MNLCDPARSFGFGASCVIDDVGVRFGGSEHHRITISFSHTRHPARKGRDSRPPRDRATDALISIVRSVPPGTGSPISSEIGQPGSHGVRLSALFGALTARLAGEWLAAPLGALSAALPGQADRISSEARPVGLETGQSLGSKGQVPRPHEVAARCSSECGSARLEGAGSQNSSEFRAPASQVREILLHGTEHRSSSEPRRSARRDGSTAPSG